MMSWPRPATVDTVEANPTTTAGVVASNGTHDACTITALPTILAVSIFIAVLTTVTRNYRESEMVVWFASGLSLADWLRPVLRVAVPVALAVSALTLVASPWAYRQIGEYRERFEQRSDLAKVTAGQFAESSGGKRVFFAENPERPTDELGNVFARVSDFSLALRKSVGAGVRVRTPWFLLRGDYGIALQRRPGEPASRVFFSIGQAF